MLRIHFTAQDLTRTRLLTAADPLWEVMLSHFLLHEPTTPVYLRPWLQRLREDPGRLAVIRPAVHSLAGLAPQGPYFPDFLTPAQASYGLRSGLEAVASTPRRQLCHELNLLAECSRRKRRTVPGWLGPFAAGDRFAMSRLTRELRDYHRAAIKPDQDLIQTSIDADVRSRTRELVVSGVEGLFRSFAPLMTWRAPVLEVQYDVDQDLRLDGRGLRLVPSFFCHGSAVSTANPDLVPVVIYPIAHQHRWPVIVSTTGRNALGKLLGTTRAAVLEAAANGASTNGLAQTLSTSPASVSRHTTILREAGLLRTHRQGTAVLHTLTPLGQQLIDTAHEPV